MGNKHIVAGILTMFQALGQLMYNILCLLQYFCVLDFMRQLPLLLYIKLLYFHNPSSCGTRINIGESIDGMPNQAFVLVSREPYTSTRTFIINTTSLSISVVWLITSFGLMRDGAMNTELKLFRWPWVVVTGAVSGLDVVAAVAFANDSFSTKTLAEIVDFIGGQSSGTGYLIFNLNTQWAALSMIILYLRFGFLFLLNVILVVLVVIDVNPQDNNTYAQDTSYDNNNFMNDDETAPPITLPRIHETRRSIRDMKARLFNRASSLIPDRTNQTEVADLERIGTVVPPNNVLSVSLDENARNKQQKRLIKVAEDPSERQPPNLPQSVPQADAPISQEYNRSLCGSRPSVENSLNLVDVDIGDETQLPSSNGSSPGRMFRRQHGACATSFSPTRISRLFRFRTIPPYLPAEKHPSTEPPRTLVH